MCQNQLNVRAEKRERKAKNVWRCFDYNHINIQQICWAGLSFLYVLVCKLHGNQFVFSFNVCVFQARSECCIWTPENWYWKIELGDWQTMQKRERRSQISVNCVLWYWFTLFIVISYRNLKCASCDNWIFYCAVNVGANVLLSRMTSFPEMCSKFNLFRRFAIIRIRFISYQQSCIVLIQLASR